jgi:hypothetical protein
MASEHSGSWAKLGAYAVAWKYLIYVLIMKEVSRRKVHLKKGEASRIYKYIRDHHANDNASKLSALVSYLKTCGREDRGHTRDARAENCSRAKGMQEVSRLRNRNQLPIIVLGTGWTVAGTPPRTPGAFLAGLFRPACPSTPCTTTCGVHLAPAGAHDDVPALYEDAQKYRDLIGHPWTGRPCSSSWLTGSGTRCPRWPPMTTRSAGTACSRRRRDSTAPDPSTT